MGLTPAHICAGAGLTPAHICAGAGLTPAQICTGMGLTPYPTLHLHRDRQVYGHSVELYNTQHEPGWLSHGYHDLMPDPDAARYTALPAGHARSPHGGWARTFSSPARRRPTVAFTAHTMPSRFCALPAGTRISGKPDAWFSSRECIGGSVFFDNRTCLLRNVCFENGRTIFFQDPRLGQPMSHDSPYDLVWLDSYPIPEPVTREGVFNLWGPHAVNSAYPRPMREEDLDPVLHVLFKPFNDDNMAHILWDNIYALYASMTTLGVLDYHVQARLWRPEPLGRMRCGRSHVVRRCAAWFAAGP